MSGVFQHIAYCINANEIGKAGICENKVKRTIS